MGTSERSAAFLRRFPADATQLQLDRHYPLTVIPSQSQSIFVLPQPNASFSRLSFRQSLKEVPLARRPRPLLRRKLRPANASAASGDPLSTSRRVGSCRVARVEDVEFSEAVGDAFGACASAG